LGLLDRVHEHFAGDAPPSLKEVNNAFWCACHGGQRTTAEWLLRHGGADINWLGHDSLTPLDAARRNGNAELADWLSSQGACSAKAPT
jgi:hypothetical protein